MSCLQRCSNYVIQLRNFAWIWVLALFHWWLTFLLPKISLVMRKMTKVLITLTLFGFSFDFGCMFPKVIGFCWNIRWANTCFPIWSLPLSWKNPFFVVQLMIASLLTFSHWLFKIERWWYVEYYRKCSSVLYLVLIYVHWCFLSTFTLKEHKGKEWLHISC